MDTDRLADLFLHVARRMRHGQADAMAPLGLTPGQARALRLVLRAGEPMRMADLAARLGVVPRSATTVVDALEEANLVRREPDPTSRRATLIVPTERAAAVGERLREARRRAAEQVFGPLTPAQRDTLHDLLEQLAEGP